MGVMKGLIEDKSDVVIMGGGLAGLSLAIQLKYKVPDASIMVIEKARFPRPEGALKVGESTVEVGSYYFENILGLKNILDQEIRKLGLRFFFSRDANQDITQRTELGPSHFLTVWSYQLDRGRFENALAEYCEKLGVKLISESRVVDFKLARNDQLVHFEKAGEKLSLRYKWLVDAS
jgi:flavin-dependent dehydrogenase